MFHSIAVAGKGGVGKTTVSALAIRWLVDQGRAPILAVDADPSSNLHLSLGVDLGETLGSIRESMKDRAGLPPGMSQSQFVEYRLQTSLVEAEPYDFVAMGRPEGPGCYCYPNRVLKEALQSLANSYAVAVIDNEAGLENLSRRIMQRVNLLLVVSDPSIKGVRTAGHIRALADELGLEAGRLGLIMNRVNLPLAPSLKRAIEQQRLELLGIVPPDPEIARRDEQGLPIYDMAANAPALRAVGEILQVSYNPKD